MHLLTQRVLVILFGAVWTLGTAQSQSTVATPEKNKEPESASQGWHVDGAPYLWFAGINRTVEALDHEASVHVSTRSVLSYCNFGLMNAVDTRYNRIIIPVDPIVLLP